MLSVCATPIGNLGDVTPRVLDALRAADVIAAEDTRRTRKLLSHHGVHTPLTSLFSHNEAQKTEYVLGLLREGKDVALVTDAGMPGVSDPGARLVVRAVAEGLAMTVLPGPSAPVTAVVASGMTSEGGFRFVGYLPRRKRDLEAAWRDWRRTGGVVVAFDAPQRLPKSLTVLASLAPDVPGAVCRELTKVHEEVARGTLAELSMRFAGGARGEITLVVDLGAPSSGAETAEEAAGAAAAALLGKGLSRRDAAAALAVCLGVPHREAERLVRLVAAGGPR